MTYLIIVVVAVKEGLLPKNHAGKHAAQAPHVEGVVVHLQHTQPRQINVHLSIGRKM